MVPRANYPLVRRRLVVIGVGACTTCNSTYTEFDYCKVYDFCERARLIVVESLGLVERY